MKNNKSKSSISNRSNTSKLTARQLLKQGEEMVSEARQRIQREEQKKREEKEKALRPTLLKLEAIISRLGKFGHSFEMAELRTHNSYKSLFPLPGEVDTLGSDEEYMKEIRVHIQRLPEFKKKFEKFIRESEKQLASYKSLLSELEPAIAQAIKDERALFELKKT